MYDRRLALFVHRGARPLSMLAAAIAAAIAGGCMSLPSQRASLEHSSVVVHPSGPAHSEAGGRATALSGVSIRDN